MYRFVLLTSLKTLIWGATIVGVSSAHVRADRKSDRGDNTAPKAWKDLEDQSKVGDIAKAGIDIFVRRGPAKDIARKAADELGKAKERADREANRAMESGLPIQALEAMSDEVSQQLAVTLPNIPEVKASSHQVVLAFPALLDETASQRPELAGIFDSIRSRLLENECITNQFVFVSSSERDAKKLTEAIAGDDASAFRDPLQRDADQTKPVVYNPAFIYLVDGTLNLEKDFDEHTVTFTLNVRTSHLTTRQQLSQQTLRQTYMWHPKRKAWELQPD